jgi:hypothetical protein
MSVGEMMVLVRWIDTGATFQVPKLKPGEVDGQ